MQMMVAETTSPFLPLQRQKLVDANADTDHECLHEQQCPEYSQLHPLYFFFDSP
jgi:hypothetical protein